MDEEIVTTRDAAESSTQRALRYLRALEASDRDALESLLHPEIVQRELPNRLLPNGAVRDRSAILAAFDRGRGVVASQRYDVRSVIARGEHVAMEVEWTATLAIAVGALDAGDTMRASFAVFLEMRDGQVVGQRNYDCFEPFERGGAEGEVSAFHRRLAV